ncbi:uncharacterized protein O3C94_020808 [Discoglossus pictus]
MNSIHLWFLNKLYFLKHTIFGLPDAEPVQTWPWSLESPFPTWNIYSKASFAASILCFIVFLARFSLKKQIGYSKAVSRKKSAPKLTAQTASDHPLLDIWVQTFALILILCLFISIPWEWVRLYQIEVAKKTTVLSEGYARSCEREDLTLWETLKVWLSWNFSWDNDSCEDYYKALIVDPFWEVTPIMAISSALGRIIIHPMEQLGHVAGRSLRNVMKEIPMQWQPLVFLLVPLICITLMVITYLRKKYTPLTPCQQKQIITRSRSSKMA